MPHSRATESFADPAHTVSECLPSARSRIELCRIHPGSRLQLCHSPTSLPYQFPCAEQPTANHTSPPGSPRRLECLSLTDQLLFQSLSLLQSQEPQSFWYYSSPDLFRPKHEHQDRNYRRTSRPQT